MTEKSFIAPSVGLLLFAVLISLPGRGWSYVNASLRRTYGTDSYQGTYGSLDIGEDFHVRPFFSAYSASFSSGTYKTIGARVAFDKPKWGVGATIGASPKVNGYSNRIFGMDGAMSFFPEVRVPRGGTMRVDLGANVTRTTHIDELQLTKAGLLRRMGAALYINETDVGVSGGIFLLGATFSVDLTQASYDKDLAQVEARTAQILSLQGLNSTIQGFPDASVNARFDLAEIPGLIPSVSYNYTTYKIIAPPSKAWTFALAVELKSLELSGSYELLDQKGTNGIGIQDYYSFGASVRF